MLLTRLAEHAAHRSDLPPDYYRTRTIRWVITIKGDGTPAATGLEDLAGSERHSFCLADAGSYRSAADRDSIVVSLSYCVQQLCDLCTDHHSQTTR